MDTIKRSTVQNKKLTTDGMSRVQSLPPRVRPIKTYAPERKMPEIERPSAPPHAVQSELHRSTVSAISTILLASVCVCVVIGFIYSRAEMYITPAVTAATVSANIKIGRTLSNQSVQGVWVQSPPSSASQEPVSKLVRALYPQYIPVVTDSQTGLVILSKDLELLLYEHKPEFSQGYSINNIKIVTFEYDPYILVSRPDEFAAKIVFSAQVERIIDISDVKERCQYTSVLGSSNSLQRCATDIPGIAKITMRLHPWFAVRIPIARALQVYIE